MDKEHFSNLYLNANSILYVSMQETLANISADVDPVPKAKDVPAPVDEEAKTGLESLDLAALAKVWDNVPSAPTESDNYENEEVDVEDSVDEGVVEEEYQAGWLELDARGGIDYASYIQQVYEDNSLSKPIATVYEHADLNKVSELVTKLPKNVISLTDRLSGDALQQWIAINKQGNEALRDLALYIRKITIDTGIPA